MRRLLALSLTVLLTACPEERPRPPPPSTTGRCDIDFEAFSFGAVGKGAKVSIIQHANDMIGGGAAQARIGDFMLSNDRIRVVVQQPGRSLSQMPFGGNIIDADLQRPTEGGRDEFGKLGSLNAFNRSLNTFNVEILQDGENGGYAMLAATGTDAVIDTLNLKRELTRKLGKSLVIDPEVALPLTMTTYYVLSPGESRVRVVTAFCNTGKETLSIPVGDLIHPGGVTAAFNPESCTNGMGLADCDVDAMPWLGFQAEGVAYGYRAYGFGDGETPARSAAFMTSGLITTLAGGDGAAGFATWFDENAKDRPGTLGILAGDSRVFVRDFFVGRDLAEISSAMLALDAAAKSRVTLTTRNADGTIAPGAHVTVKVAETGVMQTLAVSNDDGIARFDLKPGNYLVGTAAPGHAIAPLTALSVPSNGTAEATLSLGESRALNVSIKDPFGQPLTGKVVVRCTNSPCTDQRIDYRPYFDVEDQPSDLQAIAYAGASGEARLALPPGEYEVFVTRGPEYSAWPDSFPLMGERVDLRTTSQTVNAVLAHVIDTDGWLSADFHVHAANSFDSSVPNALRVAGFAAEGVDVLVSSDHDFVTDYAPLVAELQLTNVLTTMKGNEVTPADFGHHNVFPVALPTAFDWTGGDGATLRLDQLYAGLRERDPGSIVQMNHPRGNPGGALSMMRIDTATGATHANAIEFRQEAPADATSSDTKLFSDDFDTLELMNGPRLNVAVLNDWMTFMSRGLTKTGTGDSDTHDAFLTVGGYARTWVKTADVAGLTTALRQRHATISNGPFVTMTAKIVGGDGSVFELGDTVSLTVGQQLELTVDVQAPEWMQFDSLEIHTHADGRSATDGQANETLVPATAALKKTYDPTALPLEAVPGQNGLNVRRVHVRETFTVTATKDTWFVALLRASTASRALTPLVWTGVNCTGANCTPDESRATAITNAIFVDADGSGAYDDFPLK
ncbi:MAG: CehA/McbA family metallohydrolase [Archangium sp.]